MTTTPDVREALPVWSPAGRTVVFQARPVSSPNSNDNELYALDLRSGTRTQLTESPGFDGVAQFSPNGRRIAFNSNRDGRNRIYVMDADGTDVRPLTGRPDIEGFPSWSANGRSIVYDSTRDGNTNLLVTALHGGTTMRLTDHPAVDRQPAFSPDGKRVVFVSNRDGDDDLYILDVRDGTILQVTNDPVADVGTTRSTPLTPTARIRSASPTTARETHSQSGRPAASAVTGDRVATTAALADRRQPSR